MGDLLLRNLDEPTLERLKRLAAERHQSLEDAVRDLLVSAVKPTRSQVLAAADRIRAMTPKKLETSSTDLIRADRNRR